MKIKFEFYLCFFALMYNFDPQGYRLLNKNLKVIQGISPYELLLKEAPEVLKTTQDFCHCLW